MKTREQQGRESLSLPVSAYLLIFCFLLIFSHGVLCNISCATIQRIWQNPRLRIAALGHEVASVEKGQSDTSL